MFWIHNAFIGGYKPASSFERPNPAKCASCWAWQLSSYHRSYGREELAILSSISNCESTASTAGVVKGRELRLRCAAWRSSCARHGVVFLREAWVRRKQIRKHSEFCTLHFDLTWGKCKETGEVSPQHTDTSISVNLMKICYTKNFMSQLSAPRAWPSPNILLRWPGLRH